MASVRIGAPTVLQAMDNVIELGELEPTWFAALYELVKYAVNNELPLYLTCNEYNFLSDFL